MKLPPESQSARRRPLPAGARLSAQGEPDRRHPRIEDAAHPEPRGRRRCQPDQPGKPVDADAGAAVQDQDTDRRADRLRQQVYLPTWPRSARSIADWTTYGAGVTNYLSVPDYAARYQGNAVRLPGGLRSERPRSGRLPRRSPASRTPTSRTASRKASSTPGTRAASALHPYDGQTEPKYTGFEDEGKYSWVKAPTFYDERAQVGPLANVLAMVAAGHEPTKRHLDRLVTIASKVLGAELPLSALQSTIGRHARARRPLRRPARGAGQSVEPADRQHRQGRLHHLQPADVPEAARSGASASTRRRAACCRTGR